MAMYERQNDVSGAAKVLDAATAYWTQQLTSSSSSSSAADKKQGAVPNSSQQPNVKHILNVLLEKAAEFRLKYVLCAVME
jgi:hypothetical protein